MTPLPQVSFVISTHNRCDLLLHTLGEIGRCGLDVGTFDIHVVDNASTDGTSRRVKAAFPRVRLTTLKQNLGSVAKNRAVENALGRYVVFLDDDSYPQPGSVARMIEHFEADPKLGAAGFTVTLPNGRRECSAYPDVFIGCGVGFRRRVLRLLGGLPDDFFMQAEEYDLSLRLLDAGWRVRTFDDLHVTHLKTPRARVAARTMRLDVRNNLYLILRRFPRRQVLPYAVDWMRRYAWIAHANGQRAAFWQGLIEGVLRSAIRPKRHAISDEAFEQFAKLSQTTELFLSALKAVENGPNQWHGRLARVATNHGRGAGATDCTTHRVRRVLLVDVGKNIYAYHRACQVLGVKIVAIADDRLAGRRYRGISVITDAEARKRKYDLVLIANTSPAHAEARRQEWRQAQGLPVIDLLESAGLPIGPISDERQVASEFRRTVARSA